MIRVESFSGQAEIRALAPAWRRLTASLPLKRHFHHVEWYLALAETCERHNLVPVRCIAFFADGEKLIAVFPFWFMHTQIGLMQLNSLRLASEHVDAQTARDIVMAPDLAQTQLFQGFVKYMDEHDRTWDVISLPGILEDWPRLQHSSTAPKCRF